MKIGSPKEVKVQEYRIGLTPESVHELCCHGHQVLIETSAGVGAGYTDQAYVNAGATIVETAEALFAQSELIVKVKEPQAEERKRLTPSHTLFTYLHLAPDPDQTDDLVKSGATCIAYEMVTDPLQRLPLLAPMSEVAGRMSVQAGARCLEKENGGRGVLLAGVPGVPPAKTLILGAGVVGSNATRIAVGMGAQVYVLDKSLDALRRIDNEYGNRVTTLYSNQSNLRQHLSDADLVIGAVLIPGAEAPKLISKDMLAIMPKGAVLVDVAIDQGGCFETSRPTTHASPSYIVDGIVHYCVANMPGAVARTSAQALNNATLPFILELANLGAKEALSKNPHLLPGLSVARNKLCCPAVGQAQQRESITPEEAVDLII